jgi:hypothetical protein
MFDDLRYEERISSGRTQALFWGLMALFLVLSAWRVATTGWTPLTLTVLLASLFFLFYSLNYRTLVIRLTGTSLILRFGLFCWTIPLDNVEKCQIDNLPGLMRYGGAGIHFMFVNGRYRASFNLLEYPRVVVSLKRSRLVRDVSFTTRQPQRLVSLLKAITTDSAA